MKVKSTSNLGADLPEDCLDPTSGISRETQFSLVVGKEYVVYAITVFLGHVWYFLCDESYSYYPVWNPAPLFEVKDGRISKYWQYGYSHARKDDKVRVIFAYEEWVTDPWYYHKLTDGEEKEVSNFRRYKEMMDLEFDDPMITKIAAKLGDGWLMCPECEGSWIATGNTGMVRCPNCSTLMNNPLYERS